MRASIFRRGALVVGEAPAPKPDKGQVLVRTLACGICGTDLHAMQAGHQMLDQWRRAGIKSDLTFEKDVIFGHEFCAEILDYGPDTPKRFKPGARVTSVPGGVGLSNVRSGGYGEQMALTEDLLLEVPNGLPAEHAALTEPMAVGLHAVNLARLGPTDAPLVIGCGPVGLAVVAALKAAGSGPIVAADFSPRRRNLAAALGADVVVNPADISPYSAWRDLTSTEGGAALAGNLLMANSATRTAVVFECAGVTGVVQQILENVPPNARVILVGACPTMDQFEPMLGTLKEVNLQFSMAYTVGEFAETLRRLADGVIDVAPIVTRTVGLDGVADAVARLANPEEDAKIVIAYGADQRPTPPA